MEITLVKGTASAVIYDLGNHCEVYYVDDECEAAYTPCTEDDMDERDLTAEEAAEEFRKDGFVEVPYDEKYMAPWIG